MEVPDGETLVLAALARADADESAAALTATAIAGKIDLPETMAARVSLLSTLSGMSSNGLVEAVSTEGDDPDAYAITARGRSQARSVIERYESASGTARADGERVEGTLSEIADRFDLDLVTAMARLTPGGEVTVETTLDPAFVDRERERETAERLFEAAEDGEASLLVLTGEAGIGKSALFEACCSMATDRGFETLIGRADPDRSDPYHALADAVPWAIERLDGARAPASLIGSTNGSLEETVAMRYGEIRQELLERGSDRPIVLAVEDLQWADAASLSLLAAILEGLEDVPIAVLLTERTDESTPEPRHRPLADAAACESTVRRLDPLDDDAVRELIERRVGRRGVTGGCLDAIYDHTGGIALFVEETVDELLDRGVIDPQRGTYPESLTDVPLPSVVESTVRGRLDRLDEETRRVLEAAAVVGTTVDRETLRAASDRSAGDLRGRVQLLVDGRVWERLDEETYRFASHVLRSTVLETLSPDRRASLERRVADHLAGAAEPPHAELARRYDRAGEPEPALEHAMAAGDHASEVFAHEAATDAYQLAVARARDLDRAETLLDGLDALAEIYAIRGEYESAETHLEYVRENTDDLDRIRETYRYKAWMHTEKGEADTAVEIANRGLALGGPETESYAKLLDILATAQFIHGDLRESVATARRLSDLATALENDRLIGRANLRMGACHRALGRVERSVDLLEAARSLLEPLDVPRTLSGCLNELGVSYFWADRLEDATAAHRRCEELAGETGDVGTAMHALNNLGVYAIVGADWAEARERYGRLRELAERVGNDRMLANADTNEALIEIESGDVSRAGDLLATALSLTRSIDHDHQATPTLISLGQLEVLAGRFDEAERYAEEALSDARSDGYLRMVAAATRLQGYIARERGDYRRSVEYVRDSLETARESENAEEIGQSALELASALVAVDDPEAALEYVDVAESHVDERMRTDHIRVVAKRARAKLYAGHPDGPDAVRSALEAVRAESFSQVELGLRRDLVWLALERGDRDGAIEHLERGASLASETNTRIQETWFERVLAAVRDGGVDAEALRPVSGPFEASPE